MSTAETRIAQELQRQATMLPPTSGDLPRVHRLGRHRLLVNRIAAVAGVAVLVAVAATGVAALRTGSDTSLVGTRFVFEDGYAATPNETTTLLTECLQDRGLDVSLDVSQSDYAITFDRVVSDAAFRNGITACEAELRGAGYLLPSDNPENIQVAYAQFEALAECYRAAGIEISDPPDIEEFIDNRQAGIPTWSPQAEAIRQVGIEAASAADRTCHIPTPEEVRSEQ